VLRTIEGFHADDDGDWVADLSCLHRQHVRHRPPFFDRPWVETAEGRAERIGAALDCPLCDRAELPDGLVVTRTAGPWDETSLPPAIRRDHRVAERTWAVARGLSGAVELHIATDPPITRRLEAGDEQPIPPTVLHALHVDGPMRVEVDFLVAAV
jgi:tellurite methyltransferase